MIYKFYTDRDELFECSVNIKNASVKDSIARLIIETAGVNLIFEGKVDKDKCVVPVKKLKGLIDENTTGKAKLEIILEDTYFKPWESECVIEKHTKVEINEVKNTVSIKPIIQVSVKSQTKPPTKEELYKSALFEINYIFKRLNIKDFKRNGKETVRILNEFFKQGTEYKSFKKELIKEVLRVRKT